jgi:hypothetical protein
MGQSRPFDAPPVNVWVTLDRGHWADTLALLGSARKRHGPVSFDHLVSGHEHCEGHGETERFGALEVDN